MPHLTVHALEGDLAGREAALAAALTDSIAAVYGEWARELVTVRSSGYRSGAGPSGAAWSGPLHRRLRWASARRCSRGRTPRI